jgi:2-keto-4-pentenoate hydratase/2-oxohepta-3-ene-1,7-dioic acid hydratase in catechol pathway
VQLVTYRQGQSAARLGIRQDGMIVDVERLGAASGVRLPADMLDFIDQAATALPLARRLLTEAAGAYPPGSAVPVEDVALLAPIPRTRKNMFAIGMNYKPHIEEAAKGLGTSAAIPTKPVIFSKPPTAIVGPGAPIRHDGALTQQLDWEVELAVVIGKTASRISPDKALDHVFGYSVTVDISARDCARGGQWLYSKGQDSYAPFGPVIVTADEVPDPQNLRLWLKKNGEVKQDSNTKYMIFDVKTIIADLSAGFTLEPGDVIATGTPEGVGAGRSPQEWMWPGDVIQAGVEGIGELRHPVVAV